MSAKSRGKKTSMPEAGVNITPLLDVLTVLLFFLIKSMTVNSLNIEPPKGIRLPAATVESSVEETVKVAISNDAVFVNNAPVLKLANKKFDSKDIASDNRTLVPLQKALQRELKKKYKFFKGMDMSKLPPNKALIQADKDLPFGVMKYMLHTVAISGYQDYQFVVIPNK